MLRQSGVRAVCLIWLLWVVVVLGYQGVVQARYTVVKPDNVLVWTPSETLPNSHADQIYLSDPFMNAQVAWDSEFYLSIATSGYNDPHVRAIRPQPDAQPPFDRPLSLNYAFFPLYPHLMRALAAPFSVLGLNPIAAGTLAGVSISVLGALGGMVALFDLVGQERSPDDGIRAAFYLIAFPTGFFLAQVYTEGLFIGLSFGCLALVRRRVWLLAGLLAAMATLTRAVGVALVIPLAVEWVREVRGADTEGEAAASRSLSSQMLVKGVMVLLPVLTHLVWRGTFFGGAFQIVERVVFKCEPFALDRAWTIWQAGFLSLFGPNSQTAVFYAIEFAAILLGVVSCLLILRRAPDIAVYGLVVIAISMTCGVAQGMPRYILAVPSVFLVLSRWGKNGVFDRVWTLASILLMGMLAALFSFDMWVG